MPSEVFSGDFSDDGLRLAIGKEDNYIRLLRLLHRISLDSSKLNLNDLAKPSSISLYL